MISTTIRFYAVGLNEKNLAYDYEALQNILSNGLIKEDGQAYELSLTALPFGQIFNISQEVYNKVKSATYLTLENKDIEKPNDPAEFRAGFINNFLQLANGNYAVSYTIDDWASFYLYPNSPYSINIDGVTERGNLPLVSGDYPNYTRIAGKGLTGSRQQSNGFKKYIRLNLSPIAGRALPTGYTCAVYFVSQPKYNGSPSNVWAHGTVDDWNLSTNNLRRLSRLNSNIYFMIFDPFGDNIEICSKHGDTIFSAHSFKIGHPDDSTIEKIMYFDFIPTPVTVQSVPSDSNPYSLITATDGITKKLYINLAPSFSDADGKDYLADIFADNGTYYKGVAISQFEPVKKATIDNNTVLNGLISRIGEAFTGQAEIDDYNAKSLYQYTPEAQTIKIKYLDCELELPPAFLAVSNDIYVEYSGDAETVVLKVYNTLIQGLVNATAATAQNTDYFDLTHVRDFKAYKNAKITGAAGLAASAVGSITAFGASVATGNVAGVVGSLAGGATGIIGNIQKLQGLTPQQLSPANSDITLTEMLKDHKGIYIEVTTDARADDMKYIYRNFEENGVALAVQFHEYINFCRMEAYNALKMAFIDVTGAPQQICRRIEEAFLNGVTLWTATDVGNKFVRNYPYEAEG